MKKLLFRQMVKLWIVQVEVSGLEGADCFEEALFQGAADAHDLTSRFHLCGERIVCIRELVKGEARHLRDDIIQSRFEGSGRVGKRDLVERHSDADLGRDTGYGVAAGLGCQSRRTGDARIDFDQVIREGIWV